MKSNFIYTIIGVILISLTACDKYLDVQPRSSISDDEMFSSEVGFQQALNGIYSQMAGQSLYGDRLTMGFVSALAQNYGVTANGAPYARTAALDFGSDEVVEHLNTIWSGAYSSIAGLNKILENTESRRNILSTEGFAKIRGEALAIRAYLHFDLLRLYGPEYVIGHADKAIPLRESVDHYSNVPETPSVIVNKLLSDLGEAKQLLESVDPILNGEVDTRRIKMNFYAVKALEARIKLYSGDNLGAYQVAKEVVESQVFSFVTSARAGATAASRDRLYLSELVFSLRNRDMLSWVDFYFRYNQGTSYKLTRTTAQINQLYENSTTDIRRLYLFESDQTYLFPSKFWQTYSPLSGEGQTSTRRTDQILPLIRLSEMYYILAETAEDPQEGLAYLNAVRNGRALLPLAKDNLTREFLETELMKEFQKEFYAEGQLFYHYKRKNVSRMLFRTAEVPLSIYKLPIPTQELEYNPTF